MNISKMFRPNVHIVTNLAGAKNIVQNRYKDFYTEHNELGVTKYFYKGKQIAQYSEDSGNLLMVY